MIIFLSAQSQTVIEMRQESGIYTIPCKVNGLKLRFIFDTGASNVSMSLSEILFMLKNDYISKDDIYGVSEAQLANGDIVENTEVLLREIEIGGIILKDVKASVIHELQAPLLLGQSAIEKLGTYQIDGSKLIRNNGPSSSSKIYDYNDVVLSDGWRDKSTMELITGEIIEVKNGIKTFHVNKVENGKINGYGKQWYENGQLRYVANYKENKIYGLGKTWHENGAIYREINYLNGEWNGKYKKWYKSGAIEEESNYVNGKEHGLSKWWYENGAIRSETNYVNGEKHGNYKTWYESGKNKKHSEFVNGQKNGIENEWYENGQLRTKNYWLPVTKKEIEAGIRGSFKGGYYKNFYSNGVLWDEGVNVYSKKYGETEYRIRYNYKRGANRQSADKLNPISIQYRFGGLKAELIYPDKEYTEFRFITNNNFDIKTITYFKLIQEIPVVEFDSDNDKFKIDIQDIQLLWKKCYSESGELVQCP